MGSVVSTMFCKAKSATKTKLFLRGNLRPLPNKNVQFWDHFFPAFFPKDSKSLKILDVRLQEVGENKPQNILHERGQTDKQTTRQTTRSKRPSGSIRWKAISYKSLRLKTTWHLDNKRDILRTAFWNLAMFFKDQHVLFLIIRSIHQDHLMLIVWRKKGMFLVLWIKFFGKKFWLKKLCYRYFGLNLNFYHLKVSFVWIKLDLILIIFFINTGFCSYAGCLMHIYHLVLI